MRLGFNPHPRRAECDDEKLKKRSPMEQMQRELASLRNRVRQLEAQCKRLEASVQPIGQDMRPPL